MTKRSAVLVMALASAAAFPLEAQVADSEGPIRQFAASFQSAWNARDAQALAALYRTDADQILGNRPLVKGRAAIEREWATALAGLAEGRTNTVRIEEIKHLGADVVAVSTTGNFAGGRSRAGGPLRASSDRAFMLLQRDGGTWALASFRVHEAAVEADAAQSLRAARERFAKAWRGNDAQAAAAVYAVDGINMVPGNADTRGRPAIQESFSDFLANNTVEQIEFTESSLDLQPFVAYEAGTFVQRYRTQSGSTVNERMRYIAVWRREAGGPWEWARFLFNEMPGEG